MRILIWTHAFHPEIGGLEVFCLQVAKGLAARGHEIEIVTNRRGSGAPESTRHQGFPVHGFCFDHALVKQDLAAMGSQHKACAAVLDRFDPEIIHLNVVHASIFNFMSQQRRRRRPALLTLHDSVLFASRNDIALNSLKTVDAMAAVSEAVRAQVLEFHPGLADRIHTILNALPQPALAPAPFPSRHDILAFGRLVPEKGFDLAIRAFAQVATRFPDATLTIVGDGKERGSLQDLAADTGFGNRIRFPGWVSPEEIPALIGRHTLVVMPSRWEPFGLAALQAAQMGRPIVAARSGGIPEIVVDGVTGKLFKSDDMPELAAALDLLLGQPELGRRMGDEARCHATQNFDFEKFLGTYEKLLLACARPND